MRTIRLIVLLSYAAVSVILGLLLISTFIPGDLPGDRWLSVDWLTCFKPATLALLAGQSPYAYAIFNPPWALFPLIPLALLPEPIGAGLLAALNVLAFGWVARLSGASRAQALVFCLSVVVLFVVKNGNIDGLTTLGLIMPPPIGLFFVICKPQIGAVIAVYWLITAWRSGGLQKVIRWFAPVTIAFVISVLIYGPYMFRTSLREVAWNTSLFPWSLPLGLYLLVRAVRTTNDHCAAGASPLFAPYLAFQSWAVIPLIWLPRHPRLFVVTTALISMAIYLKPPG